MSRFVWITLSICVIPVLANQTCTRFGDDLVPATAAASGQRNGTYVNISSSPSCPGYATRWNICYYNSTTNISSTTYFGVYRRTSGTMYNLVNGSSATFNISKNNSTYMHMYACSQFPIPQSQQYIVLPGDILVVCVQSGRPSGPGMLGIVASSVTGASVLRDSTSCTSLPSNPIDTRVGGVYRPSNGNTLHVSLDVNECAVSNGGCAQICNDLPVGNNCSCNNGYKFDGNAINGTCYVSTTTATKASSIVTTATTATVIPEAYASTKTAAIASSVVIVVIVIAIVITVVVILLLLYNRRTSKMTISSGMQGNAFDNVVYGDNGAELNTYDVAKAVYEPVKDNEETEERNLGLSHEVPHNVNTLYECDFGNDMMPAENIYGNDDEDPYCLPPSEEEELYGQLEQHKTLKISRHQIETKSALGHGQFGGVHKGKWKSPKGEYEVAIKVLDPTKSQNDDKVKFLQEAALMAQFKHPNVILLYGIVTEGGPLMLVIELAHNKDLRTHLMTLRPDPGQMIASHVRQSLLTYSQQVALGMQYLSSKSFVHRDLAARNVLVTKDCMCKIADFGLSRNLDEENYYFSHGGMIPVKWTAPEAISYKKYSTASDVWSFGCVLYEIWSLGFKPFETISNAEVVEKINTGNRLPPPPGCPLLVYKTMIHCWCPNGHARPSFRDIHLSLSQDQALVLRVPEEAASTHPQAAVLGAPLDAGKNMYIELQKSYSINVYN